MSLFDAQGWILSLSFVLVLLFPFPSCLVGICIAGVEREADTMTGAVFCVRLSPQCSVAHLKLLDGVIACGISGSVLKVSLFYVSALHSLLPNLPLLTLAHLQLLHLGNRTYFSCREG